MPNLQSNKALHTLSTFGIGGTARYFAEASSVKEMKELLFFCAQEKHPFFILGKGSNCLFDDRGYNGVVIANRIDFLEQTENIFRVGGGTSFTRLGQITAKLGYQGLEFAATIPASVGGAIYMNAGAHGQESFDHLEEVHYLTETGEELFFTKKELTWGYRFSSFQQKRGVILGATFALVSSLHAKERQKEIVAYRLQTQPLSDKSCGCIFQNPKGFSAGRLIEECGLKGKSVHGAFISEKHANFIVNRGGASKSNVLALIETIKAEVYKKKGILLQEEIRLVPYE